MPLGGRFLPFDGWFTKLWLFGVVCCFTVIPYKRTRVGSKKSGKLARPHASRKTYNCIPNKQLAVLDENCGTRGMISRIHRGSKAFKTNGFGVSPGMVRQSACSILDMARKRVSDMATENIKKTKSGSVAVHGSADDVHHVVGLGNIRVIIVPDGSSFFAQGLEIDFASQGSTIEETKKNFEHSLCATIEQHI